MRASRASMRAPRKSSKPSLPPLVGLSWVPDQQNHLTRDYGGVILAAIFVQSEVRVATNLTDSIVARPKNKNEYRWFLLVFWTRRHRKCHYICAIPLASLWRGPSFYQSAYAVLNQTNCNQSRYGVARKRNLDGCSRQSGDLEAKGHDSPGQGNC